VNARRALAMCVVVALGSVSCAIQREGGSGPKQAPAAATATNAASGMAQSYATAPSPPSLESDGDAVADEERPESGSAPGGFTPPPGAESPALPAIETLDLAGAEARLAALEVELGAKREERLSSPKACQEACRALASMGRAADRICALAPGGPAPTRCQIARDRVERAREAVEQRCGRCAR
jgi:hypothetical protein